MRAWIYNQAFAPFTRPWYRAVLAALEPGTRMLDVGVGTARSLVANAAVVKERDLRIVGVDIDDCYIRKARTAVEKAGLSDHVTLMLQSIYDHQGGPYDAAYFGASFMLMPDPVAALRHVVTQLAPGGRVHFTQTFQERRSLIAEKAKPLLVKFTTIDFGRVTYEADFFRTIEAAGVDVLEHSTLHRGVTQSFRRVVAQPRA
jgi:ubiquinone/menaquinone biosynthesis C-methylase UbiE